MDNVHVKTFLFFIRLPSFFFQSLCHSRCDCNVKENIRNGPRHNAKMEQNKTQHKKKIKREWDKKNLHENAATAADDDDIFRMV